MNFKNKLLSKSNQYNFYKENYEKLLEENKELKERIKFISYQNRMQAHRLLLYFQQQELL